ncbi:hypothetical protein ACWEQC_22060 [Streptomyces shenzhenensis]
MADTLHTNPATAFETEFQTAVQAATTATRAASAHIGDLLRDDLPTVAWLLVNTQEGTVESAYDSARQPVGIPDTEAFGKVFDTVSHVLDQVLSLGKTPEALPRNGWELTHPRPFASFPVRTKTDD